MSKNAISLLSSYLSNRKQCVKLGTGKSSFRDIIKGVPQGSILGPVLFNIVINDIFHFVTECNIYNYADDNTLSCSNSNIETVKENLENDSRNIIKWFENNKMQANRLQQLR